MSFRDSDREHREFLGRLNVEIRKEKPTRFDPDKIFKYLDRVKMLQEWNKDRRKEQPPLINLGLHACNVCNERCPHCCGWRSSVDATAILPWYLEQSVVEESAAMGVKAIQYSGGGEPWCNPHATDSVLLAKELGLKVGVITNGTAQNQRDCEVLGQTCSWIRFSMDAGTREMRKLMHGVDTWDKLLENCKLIKKNAHKDLAMGGALLINDITIKDAQSFLDTCVDLGFTYAQFRPFRFLEDECFTEEQENTIRHIVEANQDRGLEIFTSGWRMGKAENFYRTYDYCWGAHFRCEVYAHGGIYPCCHVTGDPKNAWGVVKKPGDFTKIVKAKTMDYIDVSKCLHHCIYHNANTLLERCMKDIPDEEFFG